MGGQLYLCTAATDGRIAVWTCDVSGPAVALALQLDAHQSGINAVAAHVHDMHVRLVSGGDDGDVVVHRLQQTVSGLVCLVQQRIVNAHASSVTGVAFTTTGSIVSVSVDCRLCVWSGDALELVHARVIDVADAAALVTICDGVVIAGMGMQVLQLH